MIFLTLLTLSQAPAKKRVNIKKNVKVWSLFGLMWLLGVSASPVYAQRVGPRGTTAEGEALVVPKPRGNGYMGGASGSAVGPNGGAASGSGQLSSDGAGTVEYSGSGSVDAQGHSVDVETSGTASYSEENGYSGQNTATVSGQSYDSETSGGTTTIHGAENVPTTFTHPDRSRSSNRAQPPAKGAM